MCQYSHVVVTWQCSHVVVTWQHSHVIVMWQSMGNESINQLPAVDDDINTIFDWLLQVGRRKRAVDDCDEVRICNTELSEYFQVYYAHEWIGWCLVIQQLHTDSHKTDPTCWSFCTNFCVRFDGFSVFFNTRAVNPRHFETPTSERIPERPCGSRIEDISSNLANR